MDFKENKIIELFDDLEKTDHVTTNREVFYIIRNFEDHFEDQDECDNSLAKLIKEGKIDKKRLYEDQGIFKFNKNLEEIMKA